jgi:NADH/NAD ratio-sensing transcriptional regulator Rex
MGISRFLNPEVISPNKEYIGVGNLKQDVLDLIGTSGPGGNYDEAISELRQNLDSNLERIDLEMSKKENYPIDIDYNGLVTLALGNALIPGQKYIITDYKTVISQYNISVVDGLMIMNQLVGQRTNMTISTSIVVEADTTSTLKEDARLIRHFYNDIKGNIISFNRSYDVKYDLHPTGSFDTAKVGFVPSGQFVTLKASAPGTSHILDENCELLQYYTCKSYYCTDYTLSAYDENKVYSKFLQFTNGTDNVYVRMPNNTDYPEITQGTPIYAFRDGGTSQSEDDSCTIIGENDVRQYTGYVYHMKDEFDNEADYEFDLIIKKLNYFAFGSLFTPLMYSSSRRGYYKNNKIYGSYKGSKLMIDDNTIGNDSHSLVLIMNNVISENCSNCAILASPGNTGSAIMNNFMEEQCADSVIFDSSNNNIGFNSVDVQIHKSDGNEIGPVSRVIVIDLSSHNTLGNNLEGITIIESSSNVIGNHSKNIQLEQSSENRIENQCSKLLLRSSSFNTFGMMCSDIIFSGNFINNRIGNDVTGIRFKTSASLNATDLTSIRYANIGDGVKGLVLYARQINDETGTIFYQNFDIANGLCEFKIEEPKFLQLPISPNSESMTYITKDSSGYNIIYNDGDVVNKTNDIGDITRLNTRDRTSVVAAVNEVNNAINSYIASGAGGTSQPSDNLPTFDKYFSDDSAFDYRNLSTATITEPSRDEYNIVFISGLDSSPINRFFYVHKSAILTSRPGNEYPSYIYNLPPDSTVVLGYNQSPLLDLYYNDNESANYSVYDNRMYKLTSDGSYYISARNTLIPLNEIVDVDYLSGILNDIQLDLDGIVKPTKYFPHFTAEIESFELVNLDGSEGTITSTRPVVHVVEEGTMITDYDEVLFISNPSYGTRGFPNGYAGFYARRKSAPFEYFSCWMENGKFLGSEHYNGSSLNLVDPSAGTYPLVAPNVYFNESTEELMSIANDSVNGLIRLPLSSVLNNLSTELASLRNIHKSDINVLQEQFNGIQTIVDKQLVPIVNQVSIYSSRVDDMAVRISTIISNISKLSDALYPALNNFSTLELQFNTFAGTTNEQLTSLDKNLRTTSGIVSNHTADLQRQSGRIDALERNLGNIQEDIIEYVDDEIERMSKIKYFSNYNDFANAQKQPGTLYVIGCN